MTSLAAWEKSLGRLRGLIIIVRRAYQPVFRPCSLVAPRSQFSTAVLATLRISIRERAMMPRDLVYRPASAGFSRHAMQYASRTGRFPGKTAALFKLTHYPRGGVYPLTPSSGCDQHGKWVTRHTARGYPYIAWEPSMPRIQDIYLDSVLYLYRSKHEAMEGINIGGSGFQLSFPCEQLPHPSAFLYAVTNRHVVDSGCYCVRLNTADGAMDVVEMPPSAWLRSETDDLAVCLLSGLRSDVFKIRALPNRWLISEQQYCVHDVGVGDEIVLLGRFINREGIQRNSPTARFGFIAQNLGEPVEYELSGKPHSQEAIIAEVKSIGGYSGSPVFLTGDPGVRRPIQLPDDMTYILGVDCAHIQDWEHVYDENRRPLHHLQVRTNTGMMAIVPAWKLEALLKSDKAKAERAAHEEREIRRRKAPKAVADAVIVSLPSTEANPNHREDFNSLLIAAVRKPGSKD